MRNSRATWLAIGSALLSLSACSRTTQTATSPQSVQTKVASFGNTVAKNCTATLTALDSMSSLTALENGLRPLLDLLGGDISVISALGSSTASHLASRSSLRSFAALRSAAATGGAATSSAQDDPLSKYLSQRVFTEANVESFDGASVTYLLGGADVCPYVLPDGNSSLLAVANATIAAECVSEIDKLELRVKAVEPAADALDLTLLLGSSKAAPLALELSTGSIALVTSLDGVKDALESLRTVDSSAAIPLTMAGSFDVKVTFNREVAGNVDLTISSSVRQAVELEMQDARGTSGLTTAAKIPWASLQVDGIDRKLLANLDLGKTSFSAPHQTLSGAFKQETATFAGLSFLFSGQDGQAGNFTISNIGLGDEETNVFLAGEKTYAANLDPRLFAVSFGPDAANPSLTVFTVDPSFQLTDFFDSRPYEDSDPTTAGTSYIWSLTADVGSPAVEPYAYLRDAPYYEPGAAVKVVNGTLMLTDGALTVTVAQGQCLLDAGLAIAPTSKVQEYTSGACPTPL